MITDDSGNDVDRCRQGRGLLQRLRACVVLPRELDVNAQVRVEGYIGRSYSDSSCDIR